MMGWNSTTMTSHPSNLQLQQELPESHRLAGHEKCVETSADIFLCQVGQVLADAAQAPTRNTGTSVRTCVVEFLLMP